MLKAGWKMSNPHIVLLPITTKFRDSFSATRFWYSVTTSILLPSFVAAFEGVETPDGGADSTGVDIPERSEDKNGVPDADDVGFVPATDNFFVAGGLSDDPKFMADMSNRSCPSGTSSSSKNSTISSSCVAGVTSLAKSGYQLQDVKTVGAKSHTTPPGCNQLYHSRLGVENVLEDALVGVAAPLCEILGVEVFFRTAAAAADFCFLASSSNFKTISECQKSC